MFGEFLLLKGQNLFLSSNGLFFESSLFLDLLFLVFFITSISTLYSIDKPKSVKYEIEYEHDPMRPYLSSDKIALDTELKFAKCIRLQMGGYWDEIAKLYLIIANRGHPTAQLHLGKQYVHGNGVEENYIEASY